MEQKIENRTLTFIIEDGWIASINDGLGSLVKITDDGINYNKTDNIVVTSDVYTIGNIQNDSLLFLILKLL